jgi:hypothetical protein
MNRRSFLLGITATLLGTYMSPLRAMKAWAFQNPPKTLPLHTARFTWDCDQGVCGNVEEFELVCGNIRKVLPAPSTQSILIKDVFTDTGTYTNCTIMTRNGIGTTQAEIPFPPFRVDYGANIVTLLG